MPMHVIWDTLPFLVNIVVSFFRGEGGGSQFINAPIRDHTGESGARTCINCIVK